MHEKVITALDIARTAVKTLELLASGDLGQDRDNHLLRAVSGNLEWAVELLKEADQDIGQPQGQDTTG